MSGSNTEDAGGLVPVHQETLWINNQELKLSSQKTSEWKAGNIFSIKYDPVSSKSEKTFIKLCFCTVKPIPQKHCSPLQFSPYMDVFYLHVPLSHERESVSWDANFSVRFQVQTESSIVSNHFPGKDKLCVNTIRNTREHLQNYFCVIVLTWSAICDKTP